MTVRKVDKNSSSPQTEINSWTRLKKDKIAGLEDLYLSCSQDLFRYGMAVNPNKDLVMDAIHDLFIDLWKYRKRLRDTDNVRLYLCKSLTNRLIRLSKQEIKRNQRAVLSLIYEPDADPPGEDSGDSELMIKKLQEALEVLPNKQKEIIQHVFFERMSGLKVSEIMGINLQSVYNLTSKAIASLRKNMIIFLFFF